MITPSQVSKDILAGSEKAEQPVLMPRQTQVPNATGTADATTAPNSFGANPLMRQKMQEAGFNEKPGNLGAAIGKELDNTPVSPAPGSWARSLVGAAQKVLSGVGDVSTKPTEQTSGLGGFLEGFSETAANENLRKEKAQAREDELKQQEFANKMAEKKYTLDEQQVQSTIAYNNIQKIYQQRLIHQADVKEQDENIATGEKRIAANTTDGSKTEEKGLTKSQIDDMIKDKGSEWMFSHDFQPDGKRVIGKDQETGKDIYATTYSVQTVPEKQKLTSSDLEDFKKWLPEQDVKEGDTLYGSQLQSLRSLADSRKVQTLARNKFAQDYADSELNGQIQKETVDLGPDWMKAASEHPGDPEAALNALLQDPKMRSKYPHLDADVKRSYGATDKDPSGQAAWDKMLDRKSEMAQEAMRLRNQTNQTEKAQQGMEKWYADKLATNLRARSGGLGQADQQVFNANRLGAIAKQYKDKDGNYNLPPSKYAELALGVAGLVARGAPTEEQVRNITAASIKGDLAKAITYATGKPAVGSTQALIKDLLETIDREGAVAVDTREDYMNEIRALVPYDLDPVRAQHVEQSTLPPYHPIFEKKAEEGQAEAGTPAKAGTPATPAAPLRTRKAANGVVWVIDANGKAVRPLDNSGQTAPGNQPPPSNFDAMRQAAAQRVQDMQHQQQTHGAK